MNTPSILTPDLISRGYSYAEYWTLIHRLIAQNQTTGTNHSPEMLHYTKLNIQRSKKWDEQLVIPPTLKNVLDAANKPMLWVVLTEWWCGDAAHNVPVIAKTAAANPLITLRLLLRDEHPDLMEQYLTNGGKAIPILAVYNPITLKPVGRWGPRPKPAQDMVIAHKTAPQEPYEKFVEKLHLWYARDRGQTTFEELALLIPTWQSVL